MARASKSRTDQYSMLPIASSRFFPGCAGGEQWSDSGNCKVAQSGRSMRDGRAQQRSVRLPHSRMIITDDLDLRDSVHFTADAHWDIGERFAEAYLT